MADEKNQESDDSKVTDDLNLSDSKNTQKLTSRRSFAKSGIAGGAVLMSLLSRPALGSGYNDPRCTGSILASIDAGTSLHDFDPDECRFGCTPGFWCPGQPSDARAWLWISNNTGITPGNEFIDVFGCGPAPTAALIAENFPNGTTLEAILCIPNGEGPAFVKQSARHGIAALLNAHILNIFFAPVAGYAPADIITKYCLAYGDGDFSDPAIVQALSNYHTEMADLNERGNCPLNNSSNNYFYQQGIPNP